MCLLFLFFGEWGESIINSLNRWCTREQNAEKQKEWERGRHLSSLRSAEKEIGYMKMQIPWSIQGKGRDWARAKQHGRWWWELGVLWPKGDTEERERESARDGDAETWKNKGREGLNWRMKEGSEGGSEWMNEWMNEWMKEWMNERMNEWMNEWWMIERDRERSQEGER